MPDELKSIGLSEKMAEAVANSAVTPALFTNLLNEVSGGTVSYGRVVVDEASVE